MIQNTLATVMVLLGIEAVVLWSSRQARFQGFFKYIPPVFWIYFLPMLASTVGLLDPEHPVYQKLINNLLPASLVILLMVVDIKAILKLGRTALFMFFAGSFGMMLGTVVSFFIFKGWVGAEFWAGFGALSGSWTGGSANMVAVKEAIGTPDAVFAPMVVVDTVVPYCWMGILVAFAGMQPLYDRWNNSDRRVLDYLSRRVEPAVGSPSQKLTLKKTVLIFAISAVAALAAKSAAQIFPEIKGVVTAYAWTVIFASTIGIALSFTPVSRLESAGASRIGYALLYFVLTAIGAKASLADMGQAVVLIAAGFCIVAVHAAVLIFAGRLVRAPLFLAAVASQANLGGVASAPVVAEIYQPGLASVGLLLAILGNIMGTYVGILTAQLCRAVAFFNPGG